MIRVWRQYEAWFDRFKFPVVVGSVNITALLALVFLRLY